MNYPIEIDIPLHFVIDGHIVESIGLFVNKHGVDVYGSLILNVKKKLYWLNSYDEWVYDCHPYFERPDKFEEITLNLVREHVEQTVGLKIESLCFSEAGRQGNYEIDFDISFNYTPTKLEELCKQYETQRSTRYIDKFKFDLIIHYNSFEDKFRFEDSNVTYRIDNLTIGDNKNLPILFLDLFNNPANNNILREQFCKSYDDILKRWCEDYLDSLKYRFRNGIIFG